MAAASSIKKVVRFSPNLGCDPELFFEKDGSIVGSEKVIPESTICSGKIVQDGVQVELNPAPSTCRESLSSGIRNQLFTLRQKIATTDFTVSFNPVVEVSKEEMDSLSEKAKLLGCAPSLNTYDAKATIKVPDGFRTRSAGGHIHFGCNALLSYVKKDPSPFVKLLDAILGNQSVLMDRDPNAAERRKTYGRAGEFRLPPYGLEYRTLSNFWLHSYSLFSMVMGLGRLAYSVYGTQAMGGYDGYSSCSIPAWPAADTLLNALDMGKVQAAINENDYDLAFENWRVVKEFVKEHCVDMNCCIGPKSVDDFEFFVKRIKDGGLRVWFPTDPMSHWCDALNWNGGAESFLSLKVRPERLNAERTEKAVQVTQTT